MEVIVTTVQGVRAAVVARRRELGLSQGQVAERVGVSRKWVSEFERGKSSVELGLVLRLLEALDLDARIVPTGQSDQATAAHRTSAPVDLDELLAEYRDGR